MGHRLQQTAPLFEREQPQIGRDRLGTPTATIHFDLATVNSRRARSDASITPLAAVCPLVTDQPLWDGTHTCRQSPLGQNAYSYSIHSSTQPSLK